MATYLLTWNPRRWDWEDLDDQARMSAKGRLVEGGWSCGNTKTIEEGARVFLLRQGSKSSGIVGSGWTTSTSEERKHWDPAKRRAGKKTWFVDVDWDALVPVERVLPRKSLKRGILSPSLLNTQPSGVSVEARSAAKLEKLWAKHLKRRASVAAAAQGTQQAWEGDTVEQRTYRRKRDRKLRNAAFEASHGICAVCQRDYSKILDSMGLRILQVHHRKQLACNRAPRITKVSDLAVVCANCHALIHFDPKHAIPVGKLKAMLKGAGTWLPR